MVMRLPLLNSYHGQIQILQRRLRSDRRVNRNQLAAHVLRTRAVPGYTRRLPGARLSQARGPHMGTCACRGVDASARSDKKARDLHLGAVTPASLPTQRRPREGPAAGARKLQLALRLT